MSVYSLQSKDVIAWINSRSSSYGDDGDIERMNRLEKISEELSEIFEFDLTFDPVNYGEATSQGYIMKEPFKEFEPLLSRLEETLEGYTSYPARVEEIGRNPILLTFDEKIGAAFMLKRVIEILKRGGR